MKMKVMKLITFPICILLFFGCGQSPSGKTENSQEDSILIRVAAYNVQYSKRGTSKEIGEALSEYDLDIVCFSEAPGGDWTKETAKVLGMDHVIVGLYSTAGHVDKYKTIASRTPLYGYEEILMGDTLHTATKALTRIGDKEIAVYSAHFPKGWRDQAHIDETTGKITDFIDQLKKMPAEEVTLVMGDFNFIPTNNDHISMYHDMFMDIGLDVSWKDLQIDVTKRNSSRASDPEEEGKGHVIDHIMYNPTKVRAMDGDIIEMEKPLSDHKPVWALLELE